MAKRRDWKHARAKVDREGECRNCGSPYDLQAAHVIGRVHDGPVVNPDDIVPLCGNCHRRYDAHDLDILSILTWDEQAQAVRHVGLVGAWRRTTSSRGMPG